MASEKVELEIIAKFDEAIAELNKLRVAAGKTMKEIETNTSNANKAFSSFFGHLGAELAIKAIEGIAEAAHALFETFIVEGVKAAAEEEAAINSLNQSLVSAGKFSQEASDDFIKFAHTIQETTKFSDDAVIKNAALLESLTNLDEKGLKRVSQAAINFAAGTGKSLEETFFALAKAAEGNVTPLNKLGFAIQKGKTDAETLNNTLKVLEGRFDGRAAAEVNTFAGSQAQLANQFQELQKAIGKTIIENGAFVELMKLTSSALNSVTTFITANSTAIKVGLAASLATVVDVVRGILATLDPFVRVLTAVFETVGKAIAGVAVAVTELAQGNFRNAAAAIKESVIGIGDTVTEQFTKFGALQHTADDMGKFKEASIQAFGAFKDNADLAAQSAENAKNKIGKLTEAQLEQQKKALEIAKAAEQEKLGTTKQQQELELFQKAAADKLITEQTFHENIGIIQQNAAISEVDQLLAKNDLLAQIDAEKNAGEIQRNQEQIDLILSLQNQGNDKIIAAQLKADSKKLQIDAQVKDKQRKQQEAFFSAATSLASSENSTLAAIGKTAAIAEIAIKTPQAVADSFAFGARFGGPPLGFVLGAIAATAMAAQAAKVAGLAGGIDSVPGMGSRDNFPAMLAPGERVVPSKTNQDLTSFLSGNSETNNLLQGILIRLDRMENNVVVNIGSKEIIDVVNTGIREGRVLAS